MSGINAMPTLDDYAKDINKIGNPIPNNESLRKLIRWFGDVLRDFIEDTDFKPDANNKVKNDTKDKEQKKMKKFSDKYHDFTAMKTDHIDIIATTERNKATVEEAGAKAAVAKGQTDQASEDYVNAAVSNFRAALCYYVAGSLKTPDYSKDDVNQAAYNYAKSLIDSAQRLQDAKNNEDPADVSEIVAELMMAETLFKEAKDALNDLADGAKKKGKAFTPQAKKLIDDGKDAAESGEKSANSTLKSHLK